MLIFTITLLLIFQVISFDAWLVLLIAILLFDD